MLNEADQEIIDKLTDQNQQTEAKYVWDEDFQRIVVGMLLCDRYFLCQSLGLIKPNYLVNEIHQLTCRILLEYFDNYKQLPSKIFVKQEIVNKLRDRYQGQDQETYETVKLLYLGELNTLYDYYGRGGVGDMMPGLDSSEAILDKITAFAKTQAIRLAFQKSIDIIRKNPESDATWAKVDDILKEARMVERQSDLGLDYFGTIEDRYARMVQSAESAEMFTSGFDAIDRGLHGGGLVRGELAAWMGLPGSGKSLALVVGAVKNLARGKKVLYISTEMDQDRIAVRFDTQFSLIGVNELMPRKEEVWRALNDEVKDYQDKRRLVIKQFPSGTADFNTIRAFHSQCVMYGFRPDIVIVDYPGDMRHSTNIPLHQSMQGILTNLRGFGSEENHLTLIAIQPNRGASEMGLDEFMDESNQAESFGQNRVLDAFWTLNRTDHEQKANVGRVFSAKARNGKSRYSFKIKYGFDDETLTINEISDETYRMLMNRAKDADADTTETKIDKIVTGGPRRKFEPSDGEIMK